MQPVWILVAIAAIVLVLLIVSKVIKTAAQIIIAIVCLLALAFVLLRIF